MKYDVLDVLKVTVSRIKCPSCYKLFDYNSPNDKIDELKFCPCCGIALERIIDWQY